MMNRRSSYRCHLDPYQTAIKKLCYNMSARRQIWASRDNEMLGFFCSFSIVCLGVQMQMRRLCTTRVFPVGISGLLPDPKIFL